MYCRICGKQIQDDSQFCQYCGTPVVTLENDDFQNEEYEEIIDAPEPEDNSFSDHADTSSPASPEIEFIPLASNDLSLAPEAPKKRLNQPGVIIAVFLLLAVFFVVFIMPNLSFEASSGLNEGTRNALKQVEIDEINGVELDDSSNETIKKYVLDTEYEGNIFVEVFNGQPSCIYFNSSPKTIFYDHGNVIEEANNVLVTKREYDLIKGYTSDYITNKVEPIVGTARLHTFNAVKLDNKFYASQLSFTANSADYELMALFLRVGDGFSLKAVFLNNSPIFVDQGFDPNSILPSGTTSETSGTSAEDSASSAQQPSTTPASQPPANVVVQDGEVLRYFYDASTGETYYAPDFEQDESESQSE